MNIDDRGTGPGARPATGDPRAGTTDRDVERLFALSNADADAAAVRIDTDAVLKAARQAVEDDRALRSSTPFVPTAGFLLITLGVAVGAALNPQWFVAPFVLAFVVAPALLVVGWHRQARVPGTSGRTGVPRTTQDWSVQIDRQGRALALRADELAALVPQLEHLRDGAADQRRRCSRADATSALDDLGRCLDRATAASKVLAARVTASASQAQQLAGRAQDDPGAALSEHGRFPWTVDPRQVGTVVDDLLRELGRAGDEAGDLALRLDMEEHGSRSSEAATAVAEELTVVRRQVQVTARPVRKECRQLLVAFDILHALATAREIGRITPAPGSKLAARAAVTASVLPQPRMRRAAVRHAFLDVAARRPSRLWIGTATRAAVTDGWRGRRRSRR